MIIARTPLGPFPIACPIPSRVAPFAYALNAALTFLTSDGFPGARCLSAPMAYPIGGGPPFHFPRFAAPRPPTRERVCFSADSAWDIENRAKLFQSSMLTLPVKGESTKRSAHRASLSFSTQ